LDTAASLQDPCCWLSLELEMKNKLAIGVGDCNLVGSCNYRNEILQLISFQLEWFWRSRWLRSCNWSHFNLRWFWRSRWLREKNWVSAIELSLTQFALIEHKWSIL
jgi:hypothetical protein